ncbi:MAG: cupin domain-containing protein [Elusimicrobiota bacterium]|nr:MAG: cupin domain-containing protein [Elusimicrobiota bacterium]
MTAAELAASLDLKPHPEGGFFRETYRSAASTAILYLLGEGDRSNLHRIKSDEIWHWHRGGTLELTQISPEGRAETVLISQDNPQHVVPAGYWFGGRPEKGAGFVLCGCTVAPPFEFKDFELGKRNKLVELFPLHREIIVALTPEYGCY